MHKVPQVDPPQFHPKGSSLSITPASLSPLTVHVCGVLLPRHPAPITPRISTSLLFDLPTTYHQLQQVALGVSIGAPLLLQGPPGSGKTALIEGLAQKTGNHLVKIHMGDETDARVLLGAYVATSEPGQFRWQPGVLTVAVQEGRWVLLEDVDSTGGEVQSLLAPLVEQGQLTIPGRGEVIRAASGFRLFSTMTTSSRGLSRSVTSSLLGGSWLPVRVEEMGKEEEEELVRGRFPFLTGNWEKVAVQAFHLAKDRLIKDQGPGDARRLTLRDLVRWCERVERRVPNFTSIISKTNGAGGLDLPTRELLWAEALDVYVASMKEKVIPEGEMSLSEELAILFGVGGRDKAKWREESYVPEIVEPSSKKGGRIGRVPLPPLPASTQSRNKGGSFARTVRATRLLEQMAAATVGNDGQEPLLLVGETGTGKTTVVQELARWMDRRLRVVNLSQQTDTADLLGGFKPVDVRVAASTLLNRFMVLFGRTFSRKRNARFVEAVEVAYARGQWRRFGKIIEEASLLAERKYKQNAEDDEGAKRRKVEEARITQGSNLSTTTIAPTTSSVKVSPLPEWLSLRQEVRGFLTTLGDSSGSEKKGVRFDFVEGVLTQAVRTGEWILLDEVNLASPEMLESLGGLLQDPRGSLLLVERGDSDPIPRDPGFRIFACMNPAGDAGKKSLPPGIRSRFTELWVGPPDARTGDISLVVQSTLGPVPVSGGDEAGLHGDIVGFYREVRALAGSGALADAAGQKVHYSLRTLTRALRFARYLVAHRSFPARRALWEGTSLTFTTQLGESGEAQVRALQVEWILRGKGVAQAPGAEKALLSYVPRPPADEGYVEVQGWWVRQAAQAIAQGEEAPAKDLPVFVLTPSVRANLSDLARVMAAGEGERYPVLLQGPTAAGKTSMVGYLAACTGHTLVRVNNHEHTDLQEYIGGYVSSQEEAEGDVPLVFKEGVLVQALRKGHWLVLDELNLAPSEVLEALNRLLDDNRELLIPETGEIVRPHPDFALFATQNPGGLYGGRKALSRAFRNRFVELHVRGIPVNELQEMVEVRVPWLAPSWARRMVQVYETLQSERRAAAVFAGKEGFMTLRDLFRWAHRVGGREGQKAQGQGEGGMKEEGFSEGGLADQDGMLRLAQEGFRLIGERMRRESEREVIRQALEKVMRVKLPRGSTEETYNDTWSLDAYGRLLGQGVNDPREKEELRQLKEGIVWTRAWRRTFSLVVRALQAGEAVLLVGETGTGKTMVSEVVAGALGCGVPEDRLVSLSAHMNTETGDLLGGLRPVRKGGNGSVRKDDAFMGEDEESSKGKDALFEWQDGPLIKAMKQGQLFLLDEISLAEDAVLERLNSVLEPERRLFLAEKTQDPEEVIAAPSFAFLATMNPGGDHGKRELSPALRNRFTEIWVPAVRDSEDIRAIAKSRLGGGSYGEHWSSKMVEFMDWLVKGTMGGENAQQMEQAPWSVRDILAWVEFMQAMASKSDTGDVGAEAFVHGGSMVFLDGVGSEGSMMKGGKGQASEIREGGMRLLRQLAGLPIFPSEGSLSEDQSMDWTMMTRTENGASSTLFSLGPFSLPAGPHPLGCSTESSKSFALSAPTTRNNLMKVMRALQVEGKGILLEGSPGVGKTSLIMHLAALSGHRCLRVNLSEQTDLADLFGADLPVEATEEGHEGKKEPFPHTFPMGNQGQGMRGFLEREGCKGEVQDNFQG